MEKKKFKVKRRLKPKIVKGLLIIAIVILLIIIFVCCFKIGKWYLNGQDIKNEQKEIIDKVPINEIQDSQNTELINPPENKNNDYWNYIKMPLINADFDQLLKTNSDTVAFINVLNTNINYPVVQTNDNDYYLTRSFQKKKNSAGWIFADYRNNMILFDNNTVIYGHARKDGVLFGSLKNVLSNGWLNNSENFIVRISTPTENTMWQVFSVYTIEAESYYIQTSFSSDNEYNTWLETMHERSIHNFNTSVDVNNKVLTLSTCYNYDNTRVVLHAKLIKREAK